MGAIIKFREGPVKTPHCCVEFIYVELFTSESAAAFLRVLVTLFDRNATLIQTSNICRIESNRLF